MLKKITLLTVFLLSGFSFAFAQAPDPRDSVIIESKTVAPSLTGSPAFTLKVYITNKDTLANFTLPVELRTVLGTAFVLLNSPRTFDGTINRLTSTLGKNTVFSPLLNDASPDSAVWAGFWDPSDAATAEPPNAARKAFWEIKFGHSSDSIGQVKIDTAVIFDNRIRYVSLGGNAIGVNYTGGLVLVSSNCGIVNCGGAGGNVLFGRSYFFDFNADRAGAWSVAAGPGSINTTGVYSFGGSCALGAIPVTVRFSFSGSHCDCSFVLNIVDNPPSSSPAQAVVSVSHGQTATNQINASDPNSGDGFVFSKLSGPGTVNSSGAWSYPTGCAEVAASPFTVRVKVADRFSACNPGPLADTCQFQLLVTNALPVVSNCPADVLPIDTGTAFSLQLTGFDADPADAGSLQFSLVSGPAGLSLSPSGLVQWTPSGVQRGLHSATIRVRDLCGVSTDCQINFAVSVRKGDMNADGQLSPADLVRHFQCVFLAIPPPVGTWACDLNCDGEVTQADAILLLYVVFLGEQFPC